MRKNYRGNYRTRQEQLKNKRAQHLLCANFFPFSSFSYPRNFTRNLLSSDIFLSPCLFPFEIKKNSVRVPTFLFVRRTYSHIPIDLHVRRRYFSVPLLIMQLSSVTEGKHHASARPEFSAYPSISRRRFLSWCGCYYRYCIARKYPWYFEAIRTPTRAGNSKQALELPSFRCTSSRFPTNPSLGR